MGSDHCPVYADFHDEIKDSQGVSICIRDLLKVDTVEPSRLFTRNYEEFSDKQKKLSSFFGAKGSLLSAPIATESVPPVDSNTTTATKIPSTQQQAPTTIPIVGNNGSKKRKSLNHTHNLDKGQKLLKSYFTGHTSTKEKSPSPPIETLNEAEEDVIDLESLISEAKERQDATHSWNSLFKPREVPRCRVHNEPCRLMTVTKKGPNQGRQYYACSR